MAKHLSLIFVVLCISASSAAATCPSHAKTVSALLDLERAWAHALEQHDAATVACFLADEFEDAGVEGELSDRAATLARIPKRGPNQNRLDDLHAHIYDDTAFVRGLNEVIDPSGKRVARVRFTDVFVYRGGRWQAVAGHETLMSDGKR